MLKIYKNELTTEIPRALRSTSVSFTGETSEYSQRWHHGWQPQADPGPDLDHYFTFPGRAFEVWGHCCVAWTLPRKSWKLYSLPWTKRLAFLLCARNKDESRSGLGTELLWPKPRTSCSFACWNGSFHLSECWQVVRSLCWVKTGSWGLRVWRVWCFRRVEWRLIILLWCRLFLISNDLKTSLVNYSTAFVSLGFSNEIQAHLWDTAGLLPDHHTKASQMNFLQCV